jgi:hypothetical protein
MPAKTAMMLAPTTRRLLCLSFQRKETPDLYLRVFPLSKLFRYFILGSTSE